VKMYFAAMNPFNLRPFSHCVVIESFSVNWQKNICVKHIDVYLFGSI
jgi:hypothetical protein